jgi:hypothetical protein
VATAAGNGVNTVTDLLIGFNLINITIPGHMKRVAAIKGGLKRNDVPVR